MVEINLGAGVLLTPPRGFGSRGYEGGGDSYEWGRNQGQEGKGMRPANQQFGETETLSTCQLHSVPRSISYVWPET